VNNKDKSEFSKRSKRDLEEDAAQKKNDGSDADAKDDNESNHYSTSEDKSIKKKNKNDKSSGEVIIDDLDKVPTKREEGGALLHPEGAGGLTTNRTKRSANELDSLELDSKDNELRILPPHKHKETLKRKEAGLDQEQLGYLFSGMNSSMLPPLKENRERPGAKKKKGSDGEKPGYGFLPEKKKDDNDTSADTKKTGKAKADADDNKS